VGLLLSLLRRSPALRVVEFGTSGGRRESHCIYGAREADRLGISYLQDWRKSKLGDWVLTDDGFVVQILHCSDVPRNNSILRTCTMTIDTRTRSGRLTTEHRDSRFTFTGKNPGLPVNLTVKLRKFCFLIASGVDPVLAYPMAYSSKNPSSPSRIAYVKSRVGALMGQELVKREIQASLGDSLDKEGMSLSWLLRSYKSIIDLGENESARVSALNKISQFRGLDGHGSGDVISVPAIPQETLDRLAGYAQAEVVPDVVEDLVALEQSSDLPSVEEKETKGDSDDSNNVAPAALDVSNISPIIF